MELIELASFLAMVALGISEDTVAVVSKEMSRRKQLLSSSSF